MLFTVYNFPLKGKRDVPKSEIDAIGKQVQIKTNELNKDLDLDLSIKILGSEVVFLSLTDKSREYSSEAVIDKLFDYMDKRIQELKNFDKTFVSNKMFLDAELAYPTSLGFPLKVSVDGAVSSKVQAAGKLDILSYFGANDGKDLPIASLTFIPSANVEVAGRLTVDAHFVESGLKVASTLYASTGSAAELAVYSGKEQGYDLRYKLPLQKQQVFANHEIVFNTRELGLKENEQKLKFPQAKDFEVCTDHVSKLIGLTFCATINSPNTANQNVLLPFPFDGHYMIGVSVLTDDLKEYHVKQVARTEPKTNYEFNYEVLGEKDTKLQLAGVLSIKPDQFLNVQALAFGSKSEFETNVINKENEKAVMAKLQQDGNVMYYGKLGYTVKGQAGKYVLTPLFDYKYPSMSGEPYKLTGQLTLEEQERVTTLTFNDLKLVTPEKKDVTVKGKVSVSPTKYTSDISLGDGKNTGTFKGSLVVTPKGADIQAEFQNSFNPTNNFKLKYILELKSPKLVSDITLTHGKDLTSKQNTFTMYNSLVSRDHAEKLNIQKALQRYKIHPSCWYSN